MGDVQILEYNGNKIVLIDFSNSSIEEASTIMSKAHDVISKMPPQSVLTLTNLSGVRFNPVTTQKFREYTEQNGPYVKAAAIYGFSGLFKSVLSLFSEHSKRDLKLFESKEESLEWLGNIK